MSSENSMIYTLLREPLPAQFVATFLGRLVVNKSRPTGNYGPDVKIDLNAIVPDLYDEPASFTNLLEVYRQKTSENGRVVEAPLFRRYRMSRIPQKFESLRNNTTYSREIVNLGNYLKPGQHLCLVTGLLTCSDHRTTEHSGNVSSTGGKAGIPSEALQAAGAPPGLGLNLSTRGGGSQFTAGVANAVGEMVLAVSYHEIRYEKQQATKWCTRRCFPWTKTKATLKLIPMIGEPVQGDLEGFFGGDQPQRNISAEEQGKSDREHTAGHKGCVTDEDDVYNFQLELEEAP
ncbi:hypothetical protein F5Y08DRAFT_341359 [Xylaria arbuscula]|nr:hypothetical protein F5Y08DRAFT_341359 [Xylaria arbuscula]